MQMNYIMHGGYANQGELVIGVATSIKDFLIQVGTLLFIHPIIIKMHICF